MLMSSWPILLIMVIVYFMMLRPQMKRQKEHTAMMKSLGKGDEVVTAGGVHGRIVHAIEKESTVQVMIAKGIIVTIERGSISRRKSSNGDSTDTKMSDVKSRGTEGEATSKEIWGTTPGSAGVITSGSRTQLSDRPAGSNDESYQRNRRHRRPRRRRPPFQSDRGQVQQSPKDSSEASPPGDKIME